MKVQLTWQPHSLSLGGYKLPRDRGRREAVGLARQREVGPEGAVAVLWRRDDGRRLLSTDFGSFTTTVNC